MVATELITGMEDIINHIKQLEQENKELKEENKKLKEEKEREYDGRCADNDDNESRENKLKEEIKTLKEANNLWYSGMSKLFDEPDGEKSSVEIEMDAGKVVVVRREFFRDMTGISGVGQMIEETGEWFMKTHSNSLDFMRWSEADPVIMVRKILKEYDGYYEKQKDYAEIIDELAQYIEYIDQNACDVFNKFTEKRRDVFDEAECHIKKN